MSTPQASFKEKIEMKTKADVLHRVDRLIDYIEALISSYPYLADTFDMELTKLEGISGDLANDMFYSDDNVSSYEF